MGLMSLWCGGRGRQDATINAGIDISSAKDSGNLFAGDEFAFLKDRGQRSCAGALGHIVSAAKINSHRCFHGLVANFHHSVYLMANQIKSARMRMRDGDAISDPGRGRNLDDFSLGY